MIERVVVHIGTEKTGSTSIQANLGGNRDVLEGHGVIVPRSPGLDGNAWHLGLAAAYCDVRRLHDLGRRFGIRDAQSQREFRLALEERVRSELRREENATVAVFSSEHIHSRFVSQDAVERLHGFVATLAEHVECIVYLTRQDRLAVSKASTSTRGGAVIPSRVFPDVVGADGSLQQFYDYCALWRRFSPVFGPEQMRLRLLRKDDQGIPDVVDDFFDILGVDVSTLQTTPKRNEGLRLSAAGLHAHSLLSQRYGRLAQDFGSRSVLAQLRRLAPGGGFRSKIARSWAEEFAAIFASGNATVAEEANRGVPLFDTDFSEYPEASELEADSGVQDEVTRLLLELLGQVGEENARLRRQVQVLRQIDPQLPAHRHRADPVDALRAVDPQLRPRIGPEELSTNVTFGDGWHELEPWGVWTSERRAEMWLLVTNRLPPRTLEVRLETKVPPGSTHDVAYEMRSGSRVTRADVPLLRLTVPAGYALVQLALSMEALTPAHRGRDADPRPRGVGLISVDLDWQTERSG